MPSITYFIRTFSRKGSAIFPSEVHEHITSDRLGNSSGATPPTAAPTCTREWREGFARLETDFACKSSRVASAGLAPVMAELELVERDWEDLSERVLARLELAERF